jgi:hypothetical protein
MDPPDLIDLDQLAPTDRAAMLLGIAYTDFKRVLLEHPESAITMHPAILLEMVRLGFQEMEPLRIIIRHKLAHPPRYLIPTALQSLIPTNQNLKESVLILYKVPSENHLSLFIISNHHQLCIIIHYYFSF